MAPHPLETAPLDERFKNLNYRPDNKLGLVLLALVCLVMLAANRFAFPLLGGPVSEFEMYLAFSLSGVIMAEFALLAVWVVLSNQSFVRRIQFLFCASVASLAAWLLGYLESFSEVVGIHWANDPLIYYLGFLPLVFLAAALPLIALRFFFARVLAPIDDPQPPIRQPVTTAGLMATTAIIAFVLATVQLPRLVEEGQADIWTASGIFSGISFLIGLVVVLPSVLILCSSRRSFLPWSLVILGATVLLTVSVLLLLSRWTGFSTDEIMVPVQVAASGMVVFLLGIAAIRWFGYRLVKSDGSATQRH